MQVNVYEADATTLRARNVYLRDVTGDDDAEYAKARDELDRAGRYWIGGGAAPLFFIQRCVLTQRG